MGGVDSFDALVSVYGIDVRGKKWHWHNYTITVVVLKRVVFKVFELANPDAKMDILTFTCQVAMYYLKAAKMRRQGPQTSFIQEKDPRSSSRKSKKPGKPHCWKCSQKRSRFCPNRARTWSPIHSLQKV